MTDASAGRRAKARSGQNLIRPVGSPHSATPLVRGRDLTVAPQGRPRVAVVNEAFATQARISASDRANIMLYRATARSLGPDRDCRRGRDAIYTSLRTPAPPRFTCRRTFDHLSALRNQDDQPERDDKTSVTDDADQKRLGRGLRPRILGFPDVSRTPRSVDAPLTQERSFATSGGSWAVTAVETLLVSIIGD